MIKTNNNIYTIDYDIISRQINSKMVSIAGIVCRCRHGHPRVVLLKPDNKRHLYYTALSNPLWLTCPHLNKKIHQLESRGLISKIQNILQNNPSMKHTMELAHADLYYLRKKLFKQFCNKPTESDNQVLYTGIGGTRCTSSVKCLHLHYAHYMICSSNSIGYMIHRLLNERTACEEGCCST